MNRANGGPQLDEPGGRLVGLEEGAPRGRVVVRRHVMGPAAALLLLLAAAPPAASLCSEGERPAMSCQVKSGKVVSLCLSGKGHDTLLRYRFGRPGAVELELPAGRTRAWGAWVLTVGHAGPKRVREVRLEAKNGGVTYELIEQEGAPPVLRVTTADEKEFDLPCGPPSGSVWEAARAARPIVLDTIVPALRAGGLVDAGTEHVHSGSPGDLGDDCDETEHHPLVLTRAGEKARLSVLASASAGKACEEKLRPRMEQCAKEGRKVCYDLLRNGRRLLLLDTRFKDPAQRKKVVDFLLLR